MSAPPRCLLVLPTAFGDGLAVRGLIASLADSGRQLITVTRGAQAALLEPTLLKLRLEATPGHLDAPLGLERRAVDPARLRRLDCDEAVVLDRSWWIARARAARIPRRAAPPGLFSPFASRPLPAAEGHPADAAPAWAHALDVPWRPLPTLHVSKAWRRLAKDRLVEAKVDLDAPKVGLYRGTQGGRAGAWPDERFEELARELRRRWPKVQILILSTDAKRDLWQSVLLYEKTGKIHPVIGPEMHDDGVAAVLAQLDLFVAADCRMLHAAAAVGTPTLGLYGRSALRLAPRGEAARYLQRAPLDQLTVAEVMTTIDSLDLLGGG